MDWTKRKIEGKLAEVKQLGFVKTMRKGPTGVGYTLETLLGIQENNFYLPDLGTFELKAQRAGQAAKTTLFTFNRAAWKVDQMEAIQSYGTPNREGRLGLYQSVSSSPNKQGLRYSLDDSYVRVESVNNQVVLLE